MLVSYESIVLFDPLGILETLPLLMRYTFGHVLEVTHRKNNGGRSGGRPGRGWWARPGDRSRSTWNPRGNPQMPQLGGSETKHPAAI